MTFEISITLIGICRVVTMVVGFIAILAGFIATGETGKAWPFFAGFFSGLSLCLVGLFA